MRADRVAIEAYIKARHNMSEADIRAAIVTTQRRVDASTKEVTYHSAVLQGYIKALEEKQEKTA